MIKKYHVCDRCGKEINDDRKIISVNCRYFECCEYCYDVLNKYKEELNYMDIRYQKELKDLNAKYQIGEINGSDEDE